MNLSTTGLTLVADSAVDLQLHTSWSDGRWKPEALLDHLVQGGFGLAAVTDHDRTDTLAAVQKMALEKGLPVLVGVEMTTGWRGELVDLLCYGFDPLQSALDDLSADLLRRQQENTRQACEHVQQRGLSLPEEALTDLLAVPSARQPHAIVACLQAQGHDLSQPAVREILRGAGIRLATNEPAAVVEAAHRSGGACLLAHPGHADGFVTFDVPLLEQFRREALVDGLEVHHPRHTPAQMEMYRAYAEDNHLLVSAGSDSHSPEKQPIKYRAGTCRDLLDRVGIRVD